MPLVTCILTTYNEQEHIETALKSLLNQTFKDFDIIVFDDGSTDNTLDILKTYTDGRLKIIEGRRRGRAGALHEAVKQAEGKYIANLDADDIAFSDRIEKQVQYMEEHPDCGWLGAGEEMIDKRRNEHRERRYPATDAAIRLQCARSIPYSHSSVMFRRAIVEEGLNYNPDLEYLIDFEFFLRVANRYKAANLEEVLVRRTVRNDSYFHRTYRTWKKNRDLSRLNARAIRQFDLPFYYYLYPLLRLGYPAIPNDLKRFIRRHTGLKEQVLSGVSKVGGRRLQV
jgi:glycosyltransferase involved in cell wall biosynthesis